MNDAIHLVREPLLPQALHFGGLGRELSSPLERGSENGLVRLLKLVPGESCGCQSRLDVLVSGYAEQRVELRGHLIAQLASLCLEPFHLVDV